MKSIIIIPLMLMILVSALVADSFGYVKPVDSDQLVDVNVYVRYTVHNNNITINFVVATINNYDFEVELIVLKHPFLELSLNGNIVYSNRYAINTDKLLIKPGEQLIINTTITAVKEFNEITAYSGEFLVIVNRKSLYIIEEQKKIKLYDRESANDKIAPDVSFRTDSSGNVISTSQIPVGEQQNTTLITYAAVPLLNNTSTYTLYVSRKNTEYKAEDLVAVMNVLLILVSIWVAYKIYYSLEELFSE